MRRGARKVEGDEGEIAEEWVDGVFFLPLCGGKKTEAAEKSTTRKAEENLFDKTPGKALGRRRRGEDAGEGSERQDQDARGEGEGFRGGWPKSPKSPKETKFSPRLTRAQRGERGQGQDGREEVREATEGQFDRGLRWLEYDVVEA